MELLLLLLLPTLVGVSLSVAGGDDDDAAGGEEGEPQPDRAAPEGRQITGTLGDDTLDGAGGSDSIAGMPGDDLLYGSGGDDFLGGGSGYDLLFGEGGDDSMSGDHDDDILFGGDGHDTLSGGFGYDTLVGGAGNDLLAGGRDDDLLIGGSGADTLHGGDGWDVLIGVELDPAMVDHAVAQGALDIAADAFEDAYGAPTLDQYRDRMAETVTSADADRSGDSLDGGAGRDTLVGDGGDTLTGGADFDTFANYLGAGTGPVTIADYQLGEDIVLAVDHPADTQGHITLADGAGGAEVRLDGQTVALLQNVAAAQVHPAWVRLQTVESLLAA